MKQKRDCAMCRRPNVVVGSAFFPFCGARCRDADLGMWLTEAYRVPGEPADAETEAELAQPPR